MRWLTGRQESLGAPEKTVREKMLLAHPEAVNHRDDRDADQNRDAADPLHSST